MKPRKSLFKSAFFWFFALLFLGELAAYALLPYRSHPHAGEVYRNPTDKRAWPEFVSGGAAADKRLVVLISSSQAVGKEMQEAEKIYFAILKNALEKEFPSVSIENWSSGGIRTVDLDLLTLRAAERRADLVVFVLASVNFDPPSKLNLGYPQSDIDLLAGRPSSWAHLEDTVFYPSLTVHDIAKRCLTLESSLLRSRNDALDAMALAIPSRKHGSVFGHVISPGTRLDAYRGEGPAAPPEREDYLVSGKKLGGLKPSELDERLATFRSFHLTARRRFSDGNIRAVWVWMPIARDIFDEETIAAMESFNREASEIIRGAGADVFDLTWSIPTERFLTRSHLDERGHGLMAGMMLEILEDELQ